MREYTTKVYEASDGTIFPNKDECRKYEEKTAKWEENQRLQAENQRLRVENQRLQHTINRMADMRCAGCNGSGVVGRGVDQFVPCEACGGKGR